MIAVAISLCGSAVAYGYYSTLNLADLEGQLASMLMILMPIAAIGVLAGLMYLLGAIFIFLGRNEFGEKHRKNISYCIVLFIAMLIVIAVFSLIGVWTSISMIFNGQSQSSPASTADYFRTQLTFSLIQSSLVSVFLGLIWLLGFINLEDKKGRNILLAAFFIMLLTPFVNGIGSYRILNELTTQGTLNDLGNSTTWASTYSQIISVSQWTSVTGIIMLVVSLFSYLLLFVALYMAYKRINDGTLTAPTSKGDTYHL